MTLELEDRVLAFAQAFPHYPAAVPRIGREAGRRVLYATWVLGNRYGNRTAYYGGYPNGYLPRLLALFPEPRPRRAVLHCFSGSLPPGPYVRLDSNPRLRPDLVGNVYDVRRLVRTPRPFSLVIADPPYSGEDAKRYRTPAVDRGRALQALAGVVPAGGFVAWLDTAWPMHRISQWVTVGRITVIISTNHRVRLCTLFERVRR